MNEERDSAYNQSLTTEEFCVALMNEFQTEMFIKKGCLPEPNAETYREFITWLGRKHSKAATEVIGYIEATP